MVDLESLPESLRSLVTNIGNRLRTEFAEAERDRVQTELRWLDDLRQFKGQYDELTLKNMDKNRSRVFVKETRKKCKSIDAYLRDMLFPPNSDKNWGLSVSPEPELHPRDMEDVKRVAAIYAQRGGQFEPEKLIRAIAEERCEAMEKRIEDQLDEMRYSEIVGHDVIHSATVFGTGILKGPMVERKRRTAWVVNPETGAWETKRVEDYAPYAEFVPVWSIYPDMAATRLTDARYIFQRHLMQRRDLVQLARREDFLGPVILEYLAAVPEGDVERKNHEVQLNIMGDAMTVDNSRGRYEVLEYWGSLSAPELRQCGCEDIDPDDQGEYWANVWMLGPFVVKAEISPFDSNRHPYYFFYFDKDETSIFGEGVPSLMRDDQEILNAATRAMLDNAAITAGPQFDVNMDLLDPNEDPTEVYPLKVWMRRGEGHEAQYPAVRELRLSSYTNEYLALINTAERWGSEHTVPAYMHGQNDPRGAAGTATGMSMLMGAANIEIKDLARNFDNGITRPFIRAMFEWNMEMSDDDSIKGDFAVQARGSSSLVAKEIKAQQLDQFSMAVANPLDAPYVNRYELLKRRAEAHDIGPEIIRDKREVDAEKSSSNPAAQLQMAEIQAKVRRLASQAGLDEAKAAMERMRRLAEQFDMAMAAGDRESAMMIYAEMMNGQAEGGGVAGQPSGVAGDEGGAGGAGVGAGFGQGEAADRGSAIGAMAAGQG